MLKFSLGKKPFFLKVVHLCTSEFKHFLVREYFYLTVVIGLEELNLKIKLICPCNIKFEEGRVMINDGDMKVWSAFKQRILWSASEG